MKIYRGIGSSAGIAIENTIVFYSSFTKFQRIDLESKKEIDQEIERIRSAKEAVATQMDKTEKQSILSLDKELLPLFEAHRLFLNDKRLIPAIEEKIITRKINAEWALKLVIDSLQRRFLNISDIYIRSRFDDIHQIGEALMSFLQNKPCLITKKISKPVIVLCHNLSPLDTLYLGEGKVLGIACEVGGEMSHTSIIARALEIPAVVGVANITKNIPENTEVILDGGTGEIIHYANKKILEEKIKKQTQIQDSNNYLQNFVDQECVLKTGEYISVIANLDYMQELPKIKQLNTKKIGLIRSEFLFINQKNVPTEEEQYKLFQEISESMDQNEITIRTWDLSVDKSPLFIEHFPEQNNPALGLRGIRFCLQYQELFRIQIRAILRIASTKPVKVLLPMVSTISEILTAKRIINEEQSSLNIKPVNLKIGCMIETPAAAIMIDEILNACDFASIGTNDLIQYTVAVDRINEHVANLYSAFHPAILHLLEKIITVANEMKKPISICGEIASNPFMQMFLIGNGEIEFSMGPTQILQTRKFLRNISIIECKKIAFHFLNIKTIKENNIYLRELSELYNDFL